MRISPLVAAAAAVAAVAAFGAPAVAAGPGHQHDATTAVPVSPYRAAAAGNRTSTVGSFEPYADSYGLFQWGGTNTLTAVTLKVRPLGSRCDSRRIGIRLVTIPYHGAKHYWPWHGYTTGCGRTYTYNTFAKDTNGIHYATVELGVFSGSTLKGTRDAAPSRRPSP
ncbi:hypothetical protein [Streptomyces carpinensis]|uniref:hypothetical protein n=1 Tax=Streptomyces carpinensis TaxID=66369 RepID=UPI000A372ED5|nr:hypothetical protein [Streptomyces carpinensis]